MIAYGEIKAGIMPLIDGEGNDYYDDLEDYIPGINRAQDWLIAVIRRTLGTTTLSEENFRDLVRTGIWTTNSLSRVRLETPPYPYQVWGILAVYPHPVLYPDSPAPVVPIDPVTTKFQNNFAMASTGPYSAERGTLENSAQNSLNPYAPGNTIMTNVGMKVYRYLSFNDFSSSLPSAGFPVTYTPGGPEIQILPDDVGHKEVAITVLIRPPRLTSTSGFVSLPHSMLDLLVEKAANFMSYRQGDQTTLYAVTELDVQRLVKAMT